MDRALDLSTLPVLGRSHVQEELRSRLRRALEGKGTTLILRGDAGTGKTHLSRTLLEEAGNRGFAVAEGRAYRAESGVPYALLADAFLPLLKDLEPETLTVLSRGGGHELEQIFPGLNPSGEMPGRLESESPGEQQARVLWIFVEVLRGLAERTPLLVVLEDLQWADPSSLEGIHFLARHLADAQVLLLLTRNESEGPEEETLLQIVRSLLTHGMGSELVLPPFSREDTGALLKEAFGVGEEVGGDFADHIHRWTRGNPSFLEAILQNLIQRGRLYRKGEAWLGWETREMELPRTVKEAILDRLARLSPEARSLADLVAFLGSRASYSVLRSLTDLSETELLEAVDLLMSRKVLVEGVEEGAVVYDFRQPLVRDTLIQETSLARARILHGRIARRLEEELGERAGEEADILAYHYLRAPAQDNPSAAHHLVAAGRRALHRFGNAEAARYLEAALSLLDHQREGGNEPAWVEGGRREVLKDLARALSRMGSYDRAVPLWEEARGLALDDGDPDDAAECLRRIGIIRSYHGDPAGALEEYDRILGEPAGALSPGLVARTRLRRGVALEELGRLEDARRELEDVLEMAEDLDDPLILAQAHRALVLVHLWTGDPERVRNHGERALALARDSESLSVEFWTQWGLAVMEGLLGNTALMADHVAEADRVAEELRSPILKLRSAELAVEEAAATGRWDSGVLQGEQAISMARALSQNTILPRLLVWTALIYLSRGNVELARPLVEEAWVVSGSDPHGTPNVHARIPAYIGRGYLALAEGRTGEAIRIGREALDLADRAGYGLWAIHRLVPLLAEAYLWEGDLEGAREMGERLRSGSTPIRHKLGAAWGQTCRALVTWLEGDPEAGARMMEEAAQALEAIPMVGDAARLRRLKAGRLADIGDRRGALEELARVHEIFLHLGAEGELEKTRGMFRELGARPPRRVATGEGELSPRELEIARLVEERKSNKAIARVLGISPRTVSTHLSNVYQKLGISSRGELADYVREEGLSQKP